MAGVTATATATATVTAEDRWRQAIRARPLDPPRPLAAPLLAWARRVSGRTAPRISAGPATRAALAAVGALAATSGDVVHLAHALSRVERPSPLLAHELTHLRQPVARPRFRLALPTDVLDLDERLARAAEAFPTASAGRAAAAGALPPVDVLGRLPGGGNLGRLSRGGELDAAAALAGQQAGGLATAVSGRAQSLSAGLVASLPVGAGGPVAALDGELGGDLGGTRDAIARAFASGPATWAPIGGMPGGAAARPLRAATAGWSPHAALDEVGTSAGATLSSASAGLADSIGAAAPTAGIGGGATLDEAVGGLAASAGTAEADLRAALGDAQGLAAGTLGAIPGALGGLASGAVGALTSPGAGSGGSAAPGPLPEHVVDGLLDALEQRVLAEIERRGGRYAEVF